MASDEGDTVTADLLWVSPVHATEMREQIATLRASVERLTRERDEARAERDKKQGFVDLISRKCDAARAEAERLREQYECAHCTASKRALESAARALLEAVDDLPGGPFEDRAREAAAVLRALTEGGDCD